MKKLFFAVVSALMLEVIPRTASAQLVPCGGKDNPCQLCHIFVLLDKILDFVFLQFVPPIAVLAVVIGGVYFFMAGGDPAKLGKAKAVLTTVVIGLVIVYGSWLLINSFFMAIGVSEWTGLDNWFEYPCN
jgi:amino acid transporter